MELKPGARLHSVVCTTEVIVIRAPSEVVELRCGGHPLAAADPAGPAGPAGPVHQLAPPGLEIEAGFDGRTLLGKRYSDEQQSLELLCVKSGDGSLSIAGVLLVLSGAKPLPASD